MCRRSVTMIAAALVLGRPLAGQSIAELQARADSLLREWRQANVFAAVQDSLRAAEHFAGRDTIRVGPLVILVNPSPLPLARAAALAVPVIQRFYGPMSDALAARPILVHAVDPDSASLTPPPAAGLPVPWDQSPEQVARVLVAAADLGGLDAGLRAWLGGPAAPALDTDPLLEKVYLQLVTAPSRAARRCFTGDPGACRDALSLGDPGSLLTRWYGPDERRQLVANSPAAAWFGGNAQRRARARACAAGSDSACIAVLESLQPGAIPAPLEYAARYTLFVTAIDLGGPDAFSRLLAAPPGPMGSRLAAAAGIPADSLVARWRRDVLAARPKPVSLPPWGAWAALAWAVVFMACALGSTRWRIG